MTTLKMSYSGQNGVKKHYPRPLVSTAKLQVNMETTMNLLTLVNMNTREAQEAQHAFGIDIGGSGIKGAIVDLSTGEFLGERTKIATPRPATPDAIAEVVAELVHIKEWDGPVGITLPSVISGQVAQSAANIDKSWIGLNVHKHFSKALPGVDVAVLNDADAAGLAEIAFGATEAKEGPVIFLTFGTGIGSAFLIDGVLYPSTELGHMTVGKEEAESQASSAAKDRLDLTFRQWAMRVDTVLAEYEKLFNPSLFVVGGGISRKHEKWIPSLTIKTPVIPAKLRNRAGIVGAALAVTEGIRP